MKNLVFTLCNQRIVEVSSAFIPEFLKECKKAHIAPNGGAITKDGQYFYLETHINDYEARVIADHYHLLGEYQHEVSKGASPIEALAEWDLL